jgi:hypothetical protein
MQMCEWRPRSRWSREDLDAGFGWQMGGVGLAAEVR